MECGLDDPSILELHHVGGGGYEGHPRVVWRGIVLGTVTADGKVLLCPNCHERKSRIQKGGVVADNLDQALKEVGWT